MAALRLRRRMAPLVAVAVISGGAVVGTDVLSGDSAPESSQTATQAPSPQVTPRPPVETTAPSTPTTQRKGSPLRRARIAILRRTNAARAEEGKPRLRLKRPMNRVAQRWTKRMAAASSMSHNPVVGDQIPAGWSTWAENVAYGYTPRTVVTAWMNSPGHRENILRDVSHIGIGVARNDDGTRYFTQVFAKY